MTHPTLKEIYLARSRIAGVARRTPLDRSQWLSELAGCDVYLKLECWQPTRSFKIRGAYNAVAALGEEARSRGVVAASAGNHGQGVALAARRLGVPAVIFVPRTAPETKQARIRSLGAELRVEGSIYDEAEAAAREYAAATGAFFVHAFSNPDVVAGQGTIGIEIVEDLPEVREVIVPVGGGGLIVGVGTAVKALAGPEVRVVGVQSEQTSSMYAAFVAGHVVEVSIGRTLADGLAGGVDEVSYRRARAVTDELVLVREESIARAIRALYHDDGVLAEGAGAVGVAALLERRIELSGPAVVVITGGNIDPGALASVLASG